MKTRGVLFDLYGTLIVYGDMAQAWNAWYGVVFDAFRASGLSLSHEQFMPYCSGFFDRPEPVGFADEFSVVERRLHRLAGEVQVTLPRETALQAIEQSLHAWHDYVHLDPSAKQVLGWIGRNRSLALVSNFDYAPYVHQLLVRWELEHFFDTIIVSDSAGVKKPQPDIFHQTLQRLELSPQQTIHVGDSKEDVEGAIGAGIRPVWIDRLRENCWQADPAMGVARISTLNELLELLD